LRVNGGAPTAVANGTMHPIDGSSASSMVVTLDLRPVVRVEKGWGRAATNGTSTINYTASGATVPSAHESDWQLGLIVAKGGTPRTADIRSAAHAHHHHHSGLASKLLGGCAFEPSRDASSVGDIRSGDPGQVTTAVLGHMLWGATSAADKTSHSIEGIKLAYRYVAGYTPPAGVARNGSRLSVVLVDALNHSDVATVYTSPPLVNYSFDHFTGYSPPIVVDVHGLDIPNGRALFVALRFHNEQRNLQITIDADTGLGVQVSWSAAATGGAPAPLPKLGAATNAAAVMRGPLLYSLYLEQQCTGVVKTWLPFNNTDVDLATDSQWNFAISAASDDLRFERLGGPGALPFNISRFPSVIHAKGRAVPSWTSSKSAADEPPPSPLDTSALGTTTDVLLVPYGASNIRMAGLPWF